MGIRNSHLAEYMSASVCARLRLIGFHPQIVEFRTERFAVSFYVLKFAFLREKIPITKTPSSKPYDSASDTCWILPLPQRHIGNSDIVVWNLFEIWNL